MTVCKWCKKPAGDTRSVSPSNSMDYCWAAYMKGGECIHKPTLDQLLVRAETAEATLKELESRLNTYEADRIFLGAILKALRWDETRQRYILSSSVVDSWDDPLLQKAAKTYLTPIMNCGGRASSPI